MPIDTKVEGDPNAVRSVANWIRSTLASKVSLTVDQLHTARTTASADWKGDAGDAFVARLTSGTPKAEGLETAIGSSAQAIDNFATELQRAQSDMQKVRDKAAAAGLTISGFTIQDPSPVTAEKMDAYAAALTETEAARLIEKLAGDTVKMSGLTSRVSGSW